MPNIILLMGVSSSGKSTIARELCQITDDEYLIVGFDHYVEALDKEYWPGGSREKEGFYFESEASDQGDIPILRHGKTGEKFLKEMMSDMLEKANSGKNLIIDQVLSDDEFKAIKEGCCGCNIVEIGIKPPREEVIRREKLRSDRKEGIAASAYDSFYQSRIFDLIIDSSSTSAKDAASEIFSFINQSKGLSI